MNYRSAPWGWIVGLVVAWAMVRAAQAIRLSSNPYEGAAVSQAENRIDRSVFSRLKQLGLQPANACSDAVFVRRVSLDLIGTLPSAFEAREFLLDRRPNKRRLLIERLFEREAFADYWATKWCDLLRVKAEFPINLWPNAAQAYHRWIREAIATNKPYDAFVRELLTASGSNFRVGPVNFYRAVQSKTPAGIAQAVALTFMGTRAEAWSPTQVSGLAGFFSQIGYKSTAEWKEEIVVFDAGLATNDLWRAARFPDGQPAGLEGDRDPREVFADWLIQPGNPWFTRNIANRVWSWFFGRGIVHEPDDLRPDNPPSNAELLHVLEQESIAAQYDLKRLFRLILESQTYQLASVPNSRGPEAEANFAFYPLRRLEAEVLIDALNQITGAKEKYTSAIPEPFTFIPEDQRAIALPDGSITSAFLELFGRSPRDTGMESERNLRPTPAQRLHLLNSSHVLRKVEQSRMVRYQSQPGRAPDEIVTGMYLGILSRFPTESERGLATEHLQSGATNRREAVADLAWALINSAEFLYRH